MGHDVMGTGDFDWQRGRRSLFVLGEVLMTQRTHSMAVFWVAVEEWYSALRTPCLGRLPCPGRTTTVLLYYLCTCSFSCVVCRLNGVCSVFCILYFCRAHSGLVETGPCVRTPGVLIHDALTAHLGNRVRFGYRCSWRSSPRSLDL